MGRKELTKCFRTFDGIRWENWMDMHSEAEEREVTHLKALLIRVRVRAHPAGFRQAFVHPDDLQAANSLWIETAPNTATLKDS